MFNYNNVKYRYLVDSLNVMDSKNLEEFYRLSGCSGFGEFNVIAVGGIRQSGKTLAMKKNFDSSKDLYIAPRYNQVSEFLTNSYSLNSGDILFEWTKEQLKEIKSRECAFSCGYRDFPISRVLNALKENSIIYLDVFSVEIPENYINVTKIIAFMNELKKSSEFNTTRVYLVYT